jgi:thiol-disulfide isomerase/thioredoxin
MKNTIKTLILLTTIGIFLQGCQKKEIICTLKGTIYGRKSDTLYLLKATDDLRYAQIKIPIKDSTFEYTLKIPQTEAYELVFKDEADKGAWRPIYFFPEKGDLVFKLHAKNDFEKNSITGSQLTNQFRDYKTQIEDIFKARSQPINDSFQVLIEKNEYYSSEMDSLIKLMREVKDRKNQLNISNKIEELRKAERDLSPKGNAIRLKSNDLIKEINQWRYNYINSNPSLVTYYFLIEDLKSIKRNKINEEDIRNSFKVLSKDFKDHPYTETIKSMLEGIETIKIGGKYIDFTLPDLDGRMHKLSDLIKDKISVIDLWASWCGPCIITSRTMIPIYEEFKDRGFVICGVASEINNTNQLKVRLEKEKFPWINLIELDNKTHIWDKYGVSNSGGGIFMVDKDGTVLAINPTADQVKNILIEKLK